MTLDVRRQRLIVKKSRHKKQILVYCSAMNTGNHVDLKRATGTGISFASGGALVGAEAAGLIGSLIGALVLGLIGIALIALIKSVK